MANVSSGSCLCGAITYSYKDEPAVKALCYCGPCRKVSGGANTVNFAVPEGNFTLESGQPKTYAADHEWGMVLTLFFCSECGNTLWKESTAPHFKGLKLVQAGTLTDAKKICGPVQAEFYAPERADWLSPLANAAQKDDF
ncbi:hypothetical protein FZEAL_5375 [Fusarium zealandicum]|uniref:CENP-V/GFA domain-containing protein n=1 Tax=Fusarium zealandicum TaxID=1053134 RepID=A0A8H4XKM9_9HYPO|nr:hypothetical protein FZEAL_5375 [Fusarium zealandicum]